MRIIIFGLLLIALAFAFNSLMQYRAEKREARIIAFLLYVLHKKPKHD